MKEEQNINGLPKDWKWVKLGEVCEKVETVKRKEKNVDEELIYLDIGGIDNLNNRIVSHKNYKWKDAPSRAQQIIFNGDILFSTVRTYMKNTAMVDNHIYDGQIASSGFCVLRGNKKITTPKFLFYYSVSEKFLRPLNELQTGSSYPAVRDNDVFNQPLPLPPKDVQQQIISKIEELFSELDKGIEELKTAQQQLKVYRQAVLKWAFEGKLTNEDVKDGELPQGWKAIRFGELFSDTPQNGLYKPSSEYGSGIPIIRIDGFYDGVILIGYEYKRVKLSEEETKRYLLSIGDILVNRVNSMSHLGKCGLVKSLKEQTVFESNIMKVKVKKETVIPEYITNYLSSKRGIKELTKNAKHAVNQASINQTDVSNTMIPICSFEEQQQIVQEIESRLSVCDKIEETITNSLKQAEALRQSILKKAFEGKLI
jgi:type I restriction enzyme, S subunit